MNLPRTPRTLSALSEFERDEDRRFAVAVAEAGTVAKRIIPRRRERFRDARRAATCMIVEAACEIPASVVWERLAFHYSAGVKVGATTFYAASKRLTAEDLRAIRQAASARMGVAA